MHKYLKWLFKRTLSSLNISKEWLTVGKEIFCRKSNKIPFHYVNWCNSHVKISNSTGSSKRFFLKEYILKHISLIATTLFSDSSSKIKKNDFFFTLKNDFVSISNIKKKISFKVIFQNIACNLDRKYFSKKYLFWEIKVLKQVFCLNNPIQSY